MNKTTITYTYSFSATLEADRLKPGVVSTQAHKLGMDNGEPIIIAIDALLKYAQAYCARFEQTLSNDYVLGPSWLEAIKGVKALLNGDGAIAMLKGVTTDSKDNGAVESMFWSAMQYAGYTEADL